MDVQMPDGTIVTGVPDDVTQSALLERYQGYQPPAGIASLPSALPPTSNPLYGLVSRTGSLIGEGIEGVARVAEKVGDKLEGILPLSNLTAEQIANQRQLEPLFKFAESTKNWAKGINYEPSTKLADLSSNPLNAVPFIVERVISSSPDMAASVVAMPAYVAARTNEILNDRLKNDEKKLDDATVADVTAALGGAIMESTLERFATKHLFKGKPVSGKSATTRVAKELGIQSGTEGAEEAIGYLAGTVGTKKGVDSKELGESILEGAIVGGGLGGGVRGTREYLDYRKKKQEAADSLTKEDEGEIPPIEDTVQTQETVIPEPSAVPTPEGDVAQSREEMLAEFEGGQLPLAEQPPAALEPELNADDSAILAQVTATQPAQFVDPDSGVPITISLNPINDPALKLGGTFVSGGKTYYSYAPVDLLTAEGKFPPAQPAEVAPTGQLELAPVNPEGAVLPTPRARPAPPVETAGQLPLAPVNPEGTIIAPPKPVDPNVEARLAAVEPDVEGMIPNEPPPPPKVKDTRTPKAPEAPRINYGVDAKGNIGVPFEDGGLPFPDRNAAKKANKSGMKVVAVKGGFALADKTEKDIAIDKVRAKNLQAGPKGFLSAHAFIASLGGLNKKEASELDKDAAKSNIRVGGKYVYSAKGGLSIGRAAEALKEAGYIDTEDHNQAVRVLSESINEPVYSMYDADAIAEQQFEARKQQEADEYAQKETAAAKEAELVSQENSEYANYLAIEMEFGDSAKSMLDAGYTQQDLNVVGFTKASPELQAEVAALEEQIKDLGLEVADVLEALQYSPKTTELEYYTRAKSELTKAIAAAAKQGSGGNVSQANVPSAQEGITSPTEAELKSKQDAIDKAAAEKAKTDREIAAKDKAEADRKAIAAASEKSAGEFELGKSAEEDLSGQKDIFGGAKQLPELDTTGLKIPKGRNPQVVAAGKLFQAGQMSRVEFNEYVAQYTPTQDVPVDKIEPPTSLEKILGFFKSPKETERVQKVIPNGTRVGLRMDVPALNAGLPVVSIHEGKANTNPKTGKPYAGAGSVIKYASTGHVKNVMFAPRSQEKSLDMGLNPTKEPLQTVEGEWVNSTPEETFKRVKELSNDKSWTQVGFDPARHGYFYERSTGEPVASASEVYQVGRFLLAKDVKYAPKSDFLYSKTAAQSSAGDRAKVLSVAESVSADWEIVPDVVVVDNMQSAEIPQEVKDYDQTQTGGTTKNPEGFYYRGKIYLLASQLKDEADIVRVMNHEVLGHYGLRGLFGKTLNPILDQLANARRDLVQERADAYGLDMNNRNDRRQAAEEALATLAQTRPELGFVKRAISAIRTWLREHGFKNLKLTDNQIINEYIIPARNFIERGTKSPSEQLNDIRYSKSAASLQKPKPAAAWTAPDLTWKDTFIGKAQDRHVSLKRVQQTIEKLPTVTQLQDNLNAYRLEDLAHGRVQVQADDFLKFEFGPIVKEMNDNKVTEEQLTEYLLNRHAKEANELIAKRNPNNPAMQDKGSSVTTKDAQGYLNNLPLAQKRVFESIAKKVDKIIEGTQDLLLKNGIISKAELFGPDKNTAAENKRLKLGWRNMFEHYVPLRREETDYVLPSSSFKEIGSYSKSRTGSQKKVTDILSNVGIAREIAIVRSEKEKAKRAVYGLAIANPNPEFWMAVSPAAVKNEALLMQELAAAGWNAADVKNIMAEPTKAYFNKDTGLVEHKINTQNRYADFVLPVKINGQDRFVFFNPNDPRAASVITALKNADTQKLNAINSYVGNITRYFAAVNTQYNLIFGAWNFVRDVQGAMFNLTTTPLNGKQSAVAKGTLTALKDIYAGIKEKNKGTLQTNPADGSWQDFLEAGGKIGYRDQFAKINDTSTLVARELKSLNRGNAFKAARSMLNWVSSVNDVMENAVRLSAYRVALKQDMSKDQAAEIAKNLTVNFNRKGSATAGLSAYYAFLNASIQGTARLLQTLDPRTKSGRAIIAGGLAIGMAQSLILMIAGFDDDEPSEFLKERNFIIPTGWLTGKRTYAMWPYPLGFNILPNTGRLLIDGAARLADGKGVGDLAINALSMAVSSTNPLGGNAATLQSYMPTIADPFVAVYENKDAFGRPIAKEDRGLNPTPGYTRSREPANPIFQGIAEFMNTITSRDPDVKGLVSPTADQLSYIAEQVGGGVYREASRAVKYAVNVLNGEETPEHQVPLAGKIIGDLGSNSAISQKFYTNVKNMAEHELVIKAHRERRQSTAEYMRDNPEARLWQRANSLENEITKLNKTKKELYQREAPQDRIKRVEDQKIRMMKQFNDQVKRAG